MGATVQLVSSGVLVLCGLIKLSAGELFGGGTAIMFGVYMLYVWWTLRKRWPVFDYEPVKPRTMDEQDRWFLVQIAKQYGWRPCANIPSDLVFSEMTEGLEAGFTTFKKVVGNYELDVVLGHEGGAAGITRIFQVGEFTGFDFVGRVGAYDLLGAKLPSASAGLGTLAHLMFKRFDPEKILVLIEEEKREQYDDSIKLIEEARKELVGKEDEE